LTRGDQDIQPRITTKMAKGLTLHILELVLNGHDDKTVELAKATVLR
jgi:hypothetical protein